MRNIIVVVYAICAILGAGATNAYCKIDFNGNKITYASKEKARVECIQNLFLGSITAPLSLIMTGFGAYGFDWSCDNYMTLGNKQ